MSDQRVSLVCVLDELLRLGPSKGTNQQDKPYMHRKLSIQNRYFSMRSIVRAHV